jgi:hypothetical protein
MRYARTLTYHCLQLLLSVCCVRYTQAITLLDQLGLVAKDPRQVNDVSAVEYPSLPKGAQRVFHNVSVVLSKLHTWHTCFVCDASQVITLMCSSHATQTFDALQL